MTFEARLAKGQIIEQAISKWIMSRGHTVVPAYAVEASHGKGPQVFRLAESLVSPDLLVFRKGRGPIWIEAKHKSVFSWHRKSSAWTTGIDLRHYEHYRRVADVTETQVWLLFYHREAAPWHGDSATCPAACPTGLYGNELTRLSATESHRCGSRDVWGGYGPSGMVYWPESALIKLADSLEFEPAPPPASET